MTHDRTNPPPDEIMCWLAAEVLGVTETVEGVEDGR